MEHVIHEKNEKFLGGAERARRAARKRLYNHKTNNNSNNKRVKKRNNSCTTLPKSIKPFERFFASLLTTSASDLRRSNDSDILRQQVLQDVCARVNLPMPSPSPSCFRDAHCYFLSRASLVLEESRYILSEALQQRRTSKSIQVKLTRAAERKKTGFTVLTFEKEGSSGCRFTPSELYDARPGTVFELCGNRDSVLLLACCVPQRNYNGESECTTVSLMVFSSSSVFTGDAWTICPVTTLISQARQFEACTTLKNVAFLHQLLAYKERTHIKFDSDSDSSNDDESSKEQVIGLIDSSSSDDEEKDESDNACTTTASFLLPTLNPTQVKAATAFLNSPPSTLTLVQGPPGTGKTTFMVSVLCRCLVPDKRILVTAPTNKAIAVLTTRFLEALNGSTTYNVVMIGVEDKLVPNNNDDPLLVSSTCCMPLQRIFVYTWMTSMVHDLQQLHKDMMSEKAHPTLVPRAIRLIQKLTRSIPRLLKSVGAIRLAHRFVTLIRETNPQEAIRCLRQLIAAVSNVAPSRVVPELLATAHVIFSTLSSAGVSAMKQTKRVDDVFVDEAAAATEPELWIPLHLQPKRMLAVGDPMQLPASVSSPHASELGLAKSLHERLVLDCGKSHVLLDVQYRMTPTISAFPSKQFYNAKLENGENVSRSDYTCVATVLDGAPYTFLQVSGREQRLGSGGSYSNQEEALAVANMVQELSTTQSFVTNNNEPWYSPNKVRIITFYQGQVALIQSILRRRRGLGRVLVATVDSSQGCEADVCIVSFVRSNGRAGFLADDRRINVAVTRARHQLVCVGDAQGTLSQAGSQTLTAMVQDATERNVLVHA